MRGWEHAIWKLGVRKRLLGTIGYEPTPACIHDHKICTKYGNNARQFSLISIHICSSIR